MPHALGPIVVAAAVAELVGLLFLAAVLFGLQSVVPRRHTPAWATAWLAGAVAAGGGILSATLPPLPPVSRGVLTFALVLSQYLQAAWLLLGTVVLARGTPAEPRLRRAAVALPALLALGSVAVATAGPPMPVRSLVRFVLPLAAVSLAVFAAAWAIWRRTTSPPPVGARLMAGALGLYGVFRAHDLVMHLRTMLGAHLPGYPVYFGFATLAILATLGLGSVVSLLEEEVELVRLSEEKFAKLFRNSPDAIALTLPLEGGLIVDVNERFEETTGYSRQEAVGQTTVALGIFADEETRQAFAARLWRPGEPVRDRELEVRSRDEQRRVLSISSDAFEWRNRTYAVTIARDITGRKQAEQALRDSEERLRHAAEEWRQTFDALDLGIVLSDPEGRVVRMNRRALELTAEHSFARVLGERLAAFSSREPWRSLDRLRVELPGSTMSLTGEALEDAGGRAYYLLASPWPRESGGEPWSVLTFRDVTEFVAVQEQLRRARVMETMGSLVAGVAHEVRNPLFAISAIVEALQAGDPSRRDFTEHSVQLRSLVERLSRLMQDLLDYGRPSELERVPTPLEGIARRAAASLAAQAAERQVRVELEVAKDLPSLHVDGTRLEQVFVNLIANAIQHSPEGSTVRVGAGLDPGRVPACVRCSVEDEGPGITEDERARVFEPFFTRRKGGTGLGLSIVQRVVEAHGGEVAAASGPGGRFILWLPLDAPAGGGSPA